ncbi:hypothetical protein [Chryseobacterium luquanense]|uniref:Lipoprotein n=1 Tax=Chryseobacterium luquanense TaxID=2983766 RepID=A0ABT3Y428_9FLAO|nr:hypothetical protein [Chryseobacterium luquanense]MCX8532883.1 hypothetical protein [Chryseobacterium luquanense]
MRNLILPFILLLTFVFSCRENDVDEGLEQKNASYDVYISGKDNGDFCYWKNNVKHLLNYNLTTNETPTKIFVDNNNVYVKGRYGFWKNGNYTTYKQELGIPSTSVIDIFDIYIKNGNIFFVGYTWASVSSTTLAEFCYWKNGIKNLLFTDILAYNDQCTITEFNSDVYVGAIKKENGIRKSGYFKNTTFNPLFDSSTVSYQNTNVISNDNNVFFSCQQFYKNLQTNIQVTLPLLPNGFYGGKPALDENDCYTNAGNDYYYKNGNIIHTPNLSNPLIKDLKVMDQNIYMIRQDPNDIEFKVYINNVETQSIQNLNFDSSFNNITVVKL